MRGGDYQGDEYAAAIEDSFAKYERKKAERLSAEDEQLVEQILQDEQDRERDLTSSAAVAAIEPGFAVTGRRQIDSVVFGKTFALRKQTSNVLDDSVARNHDALEALAHQRLAREEQPWQEQRKSEQKQYEMLTDFFQAFAAAFGEFFRQTSVDMLKDSLRKMKVGSLKTRVVESPETRLKLNQTVASLVQFSGRPNPISGRQIRYMDCAARTKYLKDCEGKISGEIMRELAASYMKTREDAVYQAGVDRTSDLVKTRYRLWMKERFPDSGTGYTMNVLNKYLFLRNDKYLGATTQFFMIDTLFKMFKMLVESMDSVNAAIAAEDAEDQKIEGLATIVEDVRYKIGKTFEAYSMAKAESQENMLGFAITFAGSVVGLSGLVAAFLFIPVPGAMTGLMSATATVAVNAATGFGEELHKSQENRAAVTFIQGLDSTLTAFNIGGLLNKFFENFTKANAIVNAAAGKETMLRGWKHSGGSGGGALACQAALTGVVVLMALLRPLAPA